MQSTVTKMKQMKFYGFNLITISNTLKVSNDTFFSKYLCHVK